MLKHAVISGIIAALGSLLVWLFTRSLLCLVPGVGIFLVFYFLFERQNREEAQAQAAQAEAPKRLLAQFQAQVQALGDFAATIKDQAIHQQLTHMLKLLNHMLDFLATAPGKILRIRQMCTQYMPTLLDAVGHFEKAETYGFSDEAKFLAFMAGLNEGFEAMFKQLFDNTGANIEVDMALAMQMLGESGFSTQAPGVAPQSKGEAL